MKRFVDMLAEMARRYPDLWRSIDAIRAGRNDGSFKDWPDWCFIPDHLTTAYILTNQKKGNRNVKPGDAVLLPALAAWRSSQAVFRFSPPLFERLTAGDEQKDAGEKVGEASCLPLFHLPLWCCYVESPGANWTGAAQDGFFVYVTTVGEGAGSGKDADESNEPRPESPLRSEVRLIPCAFPQKTFVSLPLPLGDMSVDDAVEASLRATAARKKEKIDVALARSSRQWQDYAAMIHKMIALTLYLCRKETRFTDAEGKMSFSGNPASKRTKQGLRVFPADRPRLWLVD